MPSPRKKSDAELAAAYTQDRAPEELDEYTAAKERLRSGPVRDADLKYVAAYEQPGRKSSSDVEVPAEGQIPGTDITVMPKRAPEPPPPPAPAAPAPTVGRRVGDAVATGVDTGIGAVRAATGYDAATELARRAKERAQASPLMATLTGRKRR